MALNVLKMRGNGASWCRDFPHAIRMTSHFVGWPGECFRRLTLAADGDKSSAMKTFTVRELDREPAAVLDACDREGVVRIRRRNGRTYTVRPDAGPDRITELPDFRARTAKVFAAPIPAAQSRLVDKLLAGE